MEIITSSNHADALLPIFGLNQPAALESAAACDCGACVEQTGERIAARSSAGNSQALNLFFETPFVSSSDLMLQSVREHVAVFHPQQGRMLVINALGYSLLQACARPVRLKDLAHVDPALTPERIAPFFATLHARGIIRPAETTPVEPDLVPYADTLIAWLHLTNQCNLRCRYCYIDQTCQQMSVSTAEHALEKIFAHAGAQGYRHIKLKYAGGEPTLAADLLMRTHLLAEQLSARDQIPVAGNILTNGVAIPQVLIDFSRQHHLQWAVSLDGLGTAHDRQRPRQNGRPSARQILASLDRLQQHGITPHIPITVTRANLADLPTFVEFLLAHQWRFSLNFYRHSRNAADLRPEPARLIETLRVTYGVIERNLPDYSLLALLLDRVNFSAPHLYPCAAGRNYQAIGIQGESAPCQMLAANQANGVRRDEFKNIAVTAKDDCRTCAWRYACAGGCPLEAFQASGRFEARSPYCDVYHALAPDILRLEALRLLRENQPITHPFTSPSLENKRGGRG